MNVGDRMKRYEAAYAYKLTPRSCLVLRIDGRAFHTFTRGCNRPFDLSIMRGMAVATRKTAGEMQGFKLAYTQSDEATFLLTDFDSYETMGWFGYELNKVVSVSASLFTGYFNQAYPPYAELRTSRVAAFDSRAFIVPADDAPNAFLWRQRDWERNSIQMLARAHFSAKQLHGKGHPEVHEMLYEKGLNWAHLSDREKNGTFILRDGSELCQKLDYDGIRELAFPATDEDTES